MNTKESHDTGCKGKYHLIRWEGQDIVKCNKCGFAPRISEDEWYELLEETFNQPLPTQAMLKRNLQEDHVQYDFIGEREDTDNE